MQHGSISEYVESNHMEDIKTIAEFTDCQVPLTNGNSSNFVDHLGFRYQIYFLLPLEILELRPDILITSSCPNLLQVLQTKSFQGSFASGQSWKVPECL